MKNKYVLPDDVTPAPWKIAHRTPPGWRVEDSKDRLLFFNSDQSAQGSPDAEFICWARNNIEDILFESDRLHRQNTRLRKQTRLSRKIYEKALEIEQWLKDSNQPDTLITELKNLIHDSGIYSEGEV